MQLHLVDATYELFRSYYAPRPATLAPDGRSVGAVVGLLYSLLTLIRDEAATHVGCATDHVIRSFRNDLYPGYKTDAGVPRELLDQFDLAERAMASMGLVVWPMVEFEADDALATAAARWAESPGVERTQICTPDKDLAQCVRTDRVVMRDRLRDRTFDEAGVAARWGGLPGWGAKSAAAVLARFGHVEAIPANPGEWHVDVRSPAALNASLRAQWQDALLFRRLATLRTDAPLPQRDPDELLWRGARRTAFLALCDELGQPRLAQRPHVWQD